MRKVVAGFVAGSLWLFVANVARADDAADTRAMVQQEIKAYLKAEQEKKAKEEKEKGTMKVAWKDTITFESADKKFSGKLVGRLQVDYWDFPGTDEAFETAIGDFWDAGLFVRRMRMGFELVFMKNTKVHIEYEFARGGTNQAFADAYVSLFDLKDCGLGVPDVFVGHFFEPFGLDVMTGDNFSTFIEQNLASTTFCPFRNTGIMLQKGFFCAKPPQEDAKTFSRLLLQAGAFGAFSNSFGDGIFSDDGADEFAGDQDGWAVTGRAVYLPWVDCACPGCRLLHLGVGGTYRDDLRPDNLRFSSRPEVGIGPRSVDTGADIVADHLWAVDGELAFNYDRFTAQAEYIMTKVSAPTQGDPTYTGWYAQAAYFLTGECHPYDLGKGVFSRQKPCRSFYCQDCCRMGPGAWEVAARFSTVDLNDGTIDVQGGEEWNVTVGLNWYLNNNVKVMFNYVHADISDRPTGAGNTPTDGTLDAFGIRVAASF